MGSSLGLVGSLDVRALVGAAAPESHPRQRGDDRRYPFLATFGHVERGLAFMDCSLAGAVSALATDRVLGFVCLRSCWRFRPLLLTRPMRAAAERARGATATPASRA